jgi:spore maturation protein CgeB
MKIVFVGLSITSSWGNGHATTYRALLRELAARGHTIEFLERDVSWYADNRDAPSVPYADVHLYRTTGELRDRHADRIRSADAVVIGSYVPEGVAVAEWVLEEARGSVAFYDIDTPVTLARVGRGECDYLTAALIRRFDLYLSFTGGPMLQRLEREFGSPMARPLYCAVDPEMYFPEPVTVRWDLGYLGTYSADRQPTLERLLVTPATQWPTGRFVVAGPQYPADVVWPGNVRRVEHLPPSQHRHFYNEQRFTLNVTRADMIAAGYSPSVRLFEAAACGTVIISDYWDGLDSVFNIGAEILVARSSQDVLGYLQELSPSRLRAIGAAARRKVLAEHTSAHRAAELENYLNAVAGGASPAATVQPSMSA